MDEVGQMSLKSKIKTFFFLDDEYDYDEEERGTEEKTSPTQVYKNQGTQKKNVVHLQAVQNSAKVVLAEPRVYAEAQDIADQLKNRRSVVVNLQRIDRDVAKRIVDFLSGTVYAIGGDIQKVGTDIFLCTPDNVEVSGNISEMLKESDFDDTRW